MQTARKDARRLDPAATRGRELEPGVAGATRRVAPDPSRRHAQARTRDARVKPASARLDLNSAGEEDLEALPGIGPTLARRIVLGRPYRSVDDLRRVRGIGEGRMEDLRPLVTVR